MDRVTPSLPQASAFAQLRPTPRAFLFQVVLLWSAIGIGAKEVARWQVLDGTALGEWAFGVSATIVALSLAATGLLVGRLVDRRDPRPFLLLGFVVGAASNGVTAVALTAQWHRVQSEGAYQTLSGMLLGSYLATRRPSKPLLEYMPTCPFRMPASV